MGPPPPPANSTPSIQEIEGLTDLSKSFKPNVVYRDSLGKKKPNQGVKMSDQKIDGDENMAADEERVRDQEVVRRDNVANGRNYI